ncbi:ArdC family protein [Methylobacterium oryzae]|uniref:ArdC family protein n=1 Tax=Methylobacterium oryzae TaxID=334852 RepID=UPI002F35251F
MGSARGCVKTDEFFENVTNRVLTAIEEGTPPWVKPWATLSIPWPENPLTQKRYQGLNAFWLDINDMPYARNQWATFNQIRDAGGMVRKGEKGTHILRPIELKKAFNDAAEETEESRVLFTPYVVFNLAQADGLDHLKPVPREPKPVERRPDIDEAIARTGITILPDDNRCFYRPSTDTVHMVPFEFFEDAAKGYATTFHELGHATGSDKRLARDLTGTFKSHAYAGEELIAEMTSAFMCHHFGIDGLDRHHGAYLEGWAKMLRDDKKAILRAAGAAQKAFRHLVPEVA